MTKARDLADGASALSAVSATELGYLDGVTSAVQTQLNAKQAVVSGVNDTEIGYLDGVTSAVQTQLDAKIPKTLTTTTGDIIYASSANTPARLGVGSTGNVLTVSGGVPAWAAPAGGGKVLQVVMGTSTTGVSSTSSTLADSGLSASITPSATSSKVLVLTSQQYWKNNNNSFNAVKTALLRGTTNIAQMSTDMLVTDTAIYNIGTMAYHYLDSPSTTSATTYKVQFGSRSGTSTVGVNNNPDLSTIILMEIGA